MNDNTLNQINTWLLHKRSRFTTLSSQYSAIDTKELPRNLKLIIIEIQTLEAYFNFSSEDTIFMFHKYEGFSLYSIYTSVFPFIGIEFQSVYQCKLFLFFYRLSYYYAPSQEIWNEIINNEERLNAIKAETLNRILN